MKKSFFSAVLWSLNAVVFAQNLSIVGGYQCKGHEVDTQKAFTCHMIIKQTQDTYVSEANCSDGTSYRGTGIFDQQVSKLSTAFINPKRPEETGISLALFNADGSIDNQWTYLDKTTIAKTFCQKIAN